MDEKHLIVSRAALAKLARCTRANVTQRCRSELAQACVGKDIDLGHPAAAAFLKRRGVSTEDTAVAAAARRSRAPLISPALLRLELRQILALHDQRYRPGEAVRLGKLLRALRRMNAQLIVNASAPLADGVPAT